VQERKLVDRLLKPDMSLQNSAQEKQFTVDGATLQKKARTKSFHVSERPPEKTFWNTGKFRTKEFGTRSSPDSRAEARLAPRTQVAKTTPYSTTTFSGVRRAADSDKAAPVSEFAGSRPFLARGKSQKALSAQDRPLTIDQVRELLNKNK
jgi:hypothetical protein